MLAVPAVMLKSNGTRSTALAIVYILLYYVYFRNSRVKTEIYLHLCIHNDLHWIQGIDLYHIVVGVTNHLAHFFGGYYFSYRNVRNLA